MAEPSHLHPTASSSSRHTVLAVATEWDPHHGGLSTLNRNLCVALARAGHRVACLVPTAFREEVAAAAALGVELVEATPTKGKDVGPLACLLRKPALPKDFAPDIVVGHGRVTGFAAQTLVADFFPQALRIHLLHTVPSEIEWYKPRSSDGAARAEGYERAEIDLGRTAALAVGVGPRLAEELENLLAPFPLSRPVHRMDPGLDSLVNVAMEGRRPRTPPPGMHCLFLGRAEDMQLKGLDIAADAIARVRARGKQAVLVVRGAQPGTGEALQAELSVRVRAPNSVRVKELVHPGFVWVPPAG
jgi:glycosyltransferase involved in cell wall biosynthesis